MIIKLMLVDDHELVRYAISEFLALNGDFNIVAQAASGAELLNMLPSLEVDLLLLDLQMPGICGSELIDCIHFRFPNLKILIVSTYVDIHLVQNAMQAGAAGYVYKGCSPATLLDAIRKTVLTGRYLQPEIAEKLAVSSITLGRDGVKLSLSEREWQVFKRIVAGMHIKEIASDLCISDKTVSTHKANVLHKLNLNGVPELVKYAISNRLFESENE